MSQELLNQLHAKEQDLLYQLDAVRRTISALGGYSQPPARTVEPAPNVIVPASQVVPPTEPLVTEPTVIKVISNEKRLRYPKKDVYGMMIEILKEANIPCSPAYVAKRLEGLNLNYKKLTVELYLRELEKDGKILKAGKGTYAHRDYVMPTPAKQNLKTILDVIDYLKLRKTATRQELIAVFVKSGRFTEAMLQTRIEKLIKDEEVKRLEAGVYKYIDKPKPKFRQ